MQNKTSQSGPAVVESYSWWPWCAPKELVSVAPRSTCRRRMYSQPGRGYHPEASPPGGRSRGAPRLLRPRRIPRPVCVLRRVAVASLLRRSASQRVVGWGVPGNGRRESRFKSGRISRPRWIWRARKDHRPGLGRVVRSVELRHASAVPKAMRRRPDANIPVDCLQKKQPHTRLP